MGNWIGGDRDGNPFVGAATLLTAFERQSETALRYYLTQVHELGAELSNSATLQPVSAGDAPPRRRVGRLQLASRRRALSTRADRRLRAARGDAAVAHRHRGAAPCRQSRASRTPTAPRFLADLRTIEASLRSHHAQALVRPRLAPLIRAAQVFGFHLATVDLRQSSDKHEAVVAELLQGGAHRGRLLGARRGRAPRAAARRAERRAAAARRRERTRRGLQRGEPQRARRLREGRRDAAPLRPRGAAPLHHLAHRERERPARGARAAEGDRPPARHARRRRDHRADRLAALRDHRRPAQRGDDHARVLRPARHRRR